MPFTASVPMSPPGKNSGWTTKPSVVKASRPGGTSSTAPSASGSSAGLRNAGSSSFSIEVAREPPAAAVGEEDLLPAPSGTGQSREPVTTTLPGGTGAQRHRRTDAPAHRRTARRRSRRGRAGAAAARRRYR